MLHQRSEEKRAKERFELARKFANGNKTIFESGLLKKYLNRE
jgi:preprotein translocase subunit YajC